METLKGKTVFLLDMDGTIYLGDELIDGSKRFLETIKQKRKRYIFLTNNSSKNKETYVDKLNNLGIQASAEEVFTSGEATTMYLKKQKRALKFFY